MKELFRTTNFRPESLALIVRCNAIIDDYLGQGLRLTLRQLYYQLVSANVIPNVERSYKNLGGLVSDARLAGLMDWDAIEDRIRQPRRHSEFENLEGGRPVLLLKDRKGGDMAEWPQDLRIREFPA